MGPEICRRIDELAAISESPDHLTRVFLSAEQRRASELVQGWMRDAGMETHIDASATSSAGMREYDRTCRRWC